MIPDWQVDKSKPAGFSGDDAGRLLQGLFAGQYTPESFAQAYADAWNDGYNSASASE